MTHLQLFRLISLYHIRHNRLRNIFMLMVIAIGATAVFVALNLLGNSNSIREQGNNLITGSADVVITGQNIDLSQAELETIRAQAEVTNASPAVMGGALLIGQNQLLALWGIDPETEGTFRNYDLVEGASLPSQGSIILTEAYATEHNLTVGATLRLVSAGGFRTYTISGIVANTGIAILNGGDLLLMHYQDVQDLSGTSRIDTILVHSASEDSASLITRLTALLPEGVAVENPHESQAKTMTEYVTDGVATFTNIMPAIIGAMMISSTMGAAVSQRRKEIAILRSLGLSQASVRGIFLVEAAILGVLGSLLGLGLGFLLISGQASSKIGEFSVNVEQFLVWWAMPLTFVLTILLALAANWKPSSRVLEVDPTDAMRQPVGFSDSLKVNWLRFGLGLGILVLVWIIRLNFDNTPLVPMMVLVAIFVVLIACVLLFEPVLAFISPHMPKIMTRLFGFSGLIAAETLAHRPRRFIATGLVIVVVVWFSALFASWSQGATYYAQEWLSHENVWDLVVTGAGENANETLASIPPDAVDAILNRDEVTLIARERQGEVTYQGTQFQIRAIETANFIAGGGRILWEEGDESTAYERLQDRTKPTILVGGFEALIIGLRKVGTVVSLNTPSGLIDFEVIGSVHIPTGTFVMDYDLYSELWQDTQVDRLLIQTQDGTDNQEVRRSLMNRYALDGMYVMGANEIRELWMMTVTTQGMSIAVMAIFMPFMVLGIANMMFIAVLDRQREFGMLRAIGSLRWQIIWSVILEAVLLVGIASLIAVPTAYFTMDMMLFTRITGILLTVDGLGIAQLVLLILFFGALAAYLPARRAGHMNILEALRYE